MNIKKIKVSSLMVLTIIIGSLIFVKFNQTDNLKDEIKNIEATVIDNSETTLTLQDNNNVIYTFNVEDINIELGSSILLKYSGMLNKEKEVQDVIVLNTEIKQTMSDESIKEEWQDNGIFSDYYLLANEKLKTLSLDEKIGQILLVRYKDNNAIEDLSKYNFGGFVFFEKDFKDKTESEVKAMIKELQDIANIPLLTAVDEEGGKIVRVSSNPNLSNSPFKSSSELYKLGGFDLIRQDTIDKSKMLNNLGLNLNLAPVVDVSTDPNDYIYERTLGENTELTSIYAKTVIEASKNTGVSYTLKHFPGYGNNTDTHTGSSVDNRSLEDIKKYDLPPFQAGINAKAEAVLVSHNIINSIDPNNPASLSASVHNLLRNTLGFTGIVITDDLSMTAVSSISNATVKAILAGNDLIITTDYVKSFNEIKKAINDGTISEELINKLAFRVLAFKYYKGLMVENQK